MGHILVMPKLGLTMTEGTIVRWLKSKGDSVAIGDKLYDVETDKLTNTIEASVEGTLLKIMVGEGGTANCLAPVAVVGAPGEVVEDIPEVNMAKPEQPATAAAALPKAATQTGGRILAAPAAKKLASERGIDLALVPATGPGGRIVLGDVENYIAASVEAPMKASGLAGKIAADKGIHLAEVTAAGRIMAADVEAFAAKACEAEEEEAVLMSGMRKIIAKRMSESQAIAPTVSYVIAVDMTAMKAAKITIAAEGIKVSYTDLLVKIVSRILPEFPLLNCSVDGDNIVRKHRVNMGVAVALEDGLLVPVVRDAHIKSLADISAEIKMLATEAREGNLSPDSLTGGTFTITNLGMFGIESFTPIINQPEVAILGVNAMQDTVAVVDGEVMVRPIMKLSLTADHRAVDGAVAAAFLAKLKKMLEKPVLLLM